MTTTTVEKFRKYFPEYMNQAVLSHDTVCIQSQDGTAVLIGEEEYNALKETLYLLNMPGMKERLEEGLETPIEECEEFEW